MGAHVESDRLDELSAALLRARDQLNLLPERVRRRVNEVVGQCQRHCDEKAAEVDRCQAAVESAQATLEDAQRACESAQSEVSYWASQPDYEQDAEGNYVSTGASEALATAESELAAAESVRQQAERELDAARRELERATSELAIARSILETATRVAGQALALSPRIHALADGPMSRAVAFLRSKFGMLVAAQAVRLEEVPVAATTDLDFGQIPPLQKCAAATPPVSVVTVMQPLSPRLPVGYKWVPLSVIALASELSALHGPQDFKKVSYETLTTRLKLFATQIVPELRDQPNRHPLEWSEEFARRDAASAPGAPRDWLGAFETFFASTEPVYLSRGKGDASFSVINGRHRLFLARELGWNAVPARFKDLNPSGFEEAGEM